MRAKTAAVVVAVIAGATLSLPSTSYAAGPPLCDGKTPTIVGTAGVDRLTGTPGDDVVWLGAGRDSFDGRGGNDIVCGGGGGDWIELGDGADWVDGGPGNDTVNAGGGADVVFASDGDDEVYGGGGADALHGGDGDDRLFDIPLGVVSAPDDPDRYFGDAGDDWISVEDGAGADVADGGPGRDTLSYLESDVAVRLDAAAGVAAGDRFTGMEVYYGTAWNDVLRGSDRSEEIVGETGTDLIDARGGDDVVAAASGRILAGTGNDYLDAIHGSHPSGLVVDLGDGDDRALFGPGSLTIHAGAGDDRLHEAGWDSQTVGTHGHAVVWGGPGDDLLSFNGVGTDEPSRVRVSVPHHRATWHHHVVLFNSVGDFRLGERGDTFLGGRARQVVRAGPGDDGIYGRGGGDVLVGGRGYDRAYGGRGRDICRSEYRVSCEG